VCLLLLQVRDAGNLLTRAGLAMPTVDLDTFVMHYSSAVGLVNHLRLMAEGNALAVKVRSSVVVEGVRVVGVSLVVLVPLLCEGSVVSSVCLGSTQSSNLC
jgi:hypothetical protein